MTECFKGGASVDSFVGRYDSLVFPLHNFPNKIAKCRISSAIKLGALTRKDGRLAGLSCLFEMKLDFQDGKANIDPHIAAPGLHFINFYSNVILRHYVYLSSVLLAGNFNALCGQKPTCSCTSKIPLSTLDLWQCTACHWRWRWRQKKL